MVIRLFDSLEAVIITCLVLGSAIYTFYFLFPNTVNHFQKWLLNKLSSHQHTEAMQISPPKYGCDSCSYRPQCGLAHLNDQSKDRD